MKKQILAILLLFAGFPLFAEYTVTGGKNTRIEYSDAEFHHQVFILNGLVDAVISYTGPGEHQWYRYEKEANNAVAIDCKQMGNMSTMGDVRSGYGYFVGNNNDPETNYVWIIDYEDYKSMLFDIDIENVTDKCDKCEECAKCKYLYLSVDAENVNPLEYYTCKGFPISIPKVFKLQYTDLVWEDEDKKFFPQAKEIEIRDLNMPISAPLTNTLLTLSGDQFAEQFGIAQSLTTAKEYEAIALRVYSDTTVVKSYSETEQENSGSYLSAPVTIEFNAYANEPVSWYEWKIQKKNNSSGEYQDIVRFPPGKSVSYTFEEAGDFRAKLNVIGVGAVCCYENDDCKIFIGESNLQLPNAFSPGSSIGSNDIYRVSYKSLVSFKASIYNRWGNLLYHWEDPAQGWDGRVNGNYVPAGVYFIVVEAKGADGKHYYRSSDINILRSKK